MHAHVTDAKTVNEETYDYVREQRWRPEEIPPVEDIMAVLKFGIRGAGGIEAVPPERDELVRMAERAHAPGPRLEAYVINGGRRTRFEDQPLESLQAYIEKKYLYAGAHPDTTPPDAVTGGRQFVYVAGVRPAAAPLLNQTYSNVRAPSFSENSCSP